MAEHQTHRYVVLADELTQLIRKRIYPVGSLVPSVRQMSRQHGVSISTVLDAYTLLEDGGLIAARPQSGYYVRPQTGEQLPEPDVSSPGRDPSQVSLHELVMMLLRDSTNPDLVQLGGALPNPEFLPVRRLNRIITGLTPHANMDTHQYLLPPGLE